jgi:hypothetical protein
MLEFAQHLEFDHEAAKGAILPAQPRYSKCNEEDQGCTFQPNFGF